MEICSFNIFLDRGLRGLKIAVIGGKITLLGFALAGIRTQVQINTTENTLKRITDLSTSGEYGIIFIASNVFRRFVKQIEEIQKQRPIPILIELPEIKKEDVGE